MKAPDLVLRCYAEMVEGQWQAFCLDLSLAVQGESLPEAQDKLLNMIREYVCDALIGEDKEYANQLMSRRAPFHYWLKFYFIVGLKKIGKLHDDVRVLFSQPLPLILGPDELPHRKQRGINPC